MPTPTSGPSSHADAVQRRLVHRLRSTLVPVLTAGSWDQIEADHKRVGLPWRADLNPGWGKPKYVEQVLDGVSDADVIAVARRALERFPDRCAFAVEDALLWLDARGVARISEVTRLGLASVLDGRRLHPSESPRDVLDRFARSTSTQRFEYGDDDCLYVIETDILALFAAGPSANETATGSSNLALLDAYGFREWPDVRLFWFLEALVHPTAWQGDEQLSLVRALNSALAADRHELFPGDQVSGHPVFKVRPAVGGVAGRPKNLIFASTGPKPELGFADAVNNDIVILRNAEHCLVFDEPIGDGGLRWMTLVEWWAARDRLDPTAPLTRKALADRLTKALASEPERRMFNTYFRVLRPRLGEALPALVPQVYLHYDPLTLRELRARGSDRRFDVQRMDFLLLLPHGVRVVVEIDGQQHYSTGPEMSARPSPEEYARTVRSDRAMRLAGYEVYRFGGYELRDDLTCTKAVDEFFTKLFRRHKLLDAS